MKSRFFVAFLCAFLAPYLIWDFKIAAGITLALIAAMSIADIVMTKRSKKYHLMAIEGTFRAEVEGNDLKQVERELDQAMKRWQTINK